MDELLGKTVRQLKVNEDQSLLVFETSDGTVMYETEGDCCSETWFADITGVDALLGGQVTKVEEVSIDLLNDGKDRTRQEYDQGYGVNLTTTKGYVNIVYRNSSNGYYGGSIRRIDRLQSPVALTEITQDWSA